MRAAVFIPTLLVLLALAAGCASHKALAPTRGLASCELINDPKLASRLERNITDDDIAQILDADVSAKLPTRLAVAKLWSPRGWDRPCLVAPDAAELSEWEKVAAGCSHLLGVMPVNSLSGARERPTLHDLRVSAANLGCELLLVYLQADSQVDNYNDASVLYWSIVGLWLVPGNVMEHKTVMQAIVVDCRTGMILGTATGDSYAKRTYPAAFGDVRQAELEKLVPKAAYDNLRPAVAQVLRSVVDAAVAADQRRKAS